MPEQVKQFLPLLVIFVAIGIMWVVKLLLDRERYAKKAKNHIFVTILRKGRQPWQDLVMVEEIGGSPAVRIPVEGKYAKEPPVHILGGRGQFPWLYPLGKMAFVQASVPSVMYAEGDLEPIVIDDIPVVSAQHIASMIQGVSLATTDAMQKSHDESTGEKIKKASGLLWVYILIGVTIVVGIVGIVLTVKNGSAIDLIANWAKMALGIK